MKKVNDEVIQGKMLGGEAIFDEYRGEPCIFLNISQMTTKPKELMRILGS